MKAVIQRVTRASVTIDGAETRTIGPGLMVLLGVIAGFFIPITQPVLRMLALEWERLREENAPLRAVVNGRVMGVSEDFYDPVLRRCLTEKPQKVANVLGQALVQLSGVGDWLLARRLRAMAEAGTVRVDEAGSTRGFYGAAACLA